MMRLERATNVGPVLAGELRKAGIAYVEDLRELGAYAAWERVRRINPDRDCASSLLALEGAIRGVRWMSLKASERQKIAARAAAARLT